MPYYGFRSAQRKGGRRPDTDDFRGTQRTNGVRHVALGDETGATETNLGPNQVESYGHGDVE